MKILALLALLLPITVTAQTKADYQYAMAKFQRFYNAGQGDSINAMLGHGWDKMKATDAFWTNAEVAKLLKEEGTIKSLEYLGIDKTDPEKVRVFQADFSKTGPACISLTLDKTKALGTFRFTTTSEGIEELVKQKKARR